MRQPLFHLQFFEEKGFRDVSNIVAHFLGASLKEVAHLFGTCLEKGANGSAKSLRTLIKSEHYSDIKYGIKLAAGNIGESEGIYTFPYFCAFLIKRYLRESSL